ncbi:MAG: tRNA (adenosine(37)-N6)-dimethylallyltransferase MiaA [Planctomycetes bacterium]|nr:tRNA (adenosine(37)-N6)-dimethylallyltransferase MiaA [Planctomycetota bacterium]
MSGQDRPFLRILLGPTASGKERSALASAKLLGGDIISVDSMKIYRGLDIGTAKASPEMRKLVRHHCLDIAEPTEVFSTARYVSAAEDAISLVSAENRPVILSGGTALYYKNLLEGIFEGPSADPAVRTELLARAESEGHEALYAELESLDPQAAQKIHPNDIRRVVRALEVNRLTGKPISAHQTQWGKWDMRYPCAMVAIDWPRELLYKRIEERVDRMVDCGIEEEARMVFENRESYAHTPLQAVGYKEFFDYFESKATFDEAVDLLKKNTRHLAKSQMTWFRKFPCEWLEMKEGMTADDVAGAAVEIWNKAVKEQQ